MKTVLVGFVAFLVAAGVWAQGRIQFANNSRHLLYFNPNTSLLSPLDAPSAGQVTPLGGVLPSGVRLTAELWGGYSSTALALVGTTSLSTNAPGMLATRNLITQFPTGFTAYFQVLVYDVTMGSFVQAKSTMHYWGASDVFTTMTSTNIAFDGIANPRYSTWAPGTWALDNTVFGPGALGAISIQASPEPSALSLALLAMAAFAVRRSGER